MHGTMARMLLIGALLGIPGGSARSGETEGPTVAAALSLKGAFEEVGRAYEAAHPGERVRFNFAASGVLQRQIEEGAPTDVFASASSREMDELDRKGLLVVGTRSVFAGNSVVLIVPERSKPGITGFADLGMHTVRRIAVGDPATVPAGAYADETLRSLGLKELVRDKLVFAGNVRQVIDYTARGETDAGIVFATDALGAPGVVVAGRAPVPSHSAVRYHIAVVRGTANEKAARAYIRMLLAPEGQAVLRKRGFLSSLPH